MQRPILGRHRSSHAEFSRPEHGYLHKISHGRLGTLPADRSSVRHQPI